jgi:Leucine-rich repeat (LRR) protein
MNPVTNCPGDQELQRILQGVAQPEAEEGFARHLERCEGCAAAVEQALAQDTLLEAIRAQTTVPSTPGGYVPALIQRLVALHPAASSQQTVYAPSPTDTLGTPPGEAGRYDFLAPPQAPDELGRLGPYRVLKLAGQGGMGVVFQAEDVRLKRMVALKLIKPEAAGKPGARERFLREAQAAAALEHENIVAVYQVDDAGGVPFLAMPWLKGMSLEERLRQVGVLTVPQVLRLGKQIARGLAAAHEAGLVHRDVKPANVWLEPAGGGRVKLLDFGLAHVPSDPGLTQSGTVLGTPAYMAPEQARGEKASPGCDLFSLGAVLYRLCTGQLPFRGENTMALLTALAVDEPAPVGQLAPALPPALAELVMQLLAKDPGKRPASAQEVADRLEAIERQLAAPSGPSRTEALPAPAAPARRGRRKRAGLIAAVALAIALPLGYFSGGAVLRYATNKGVLVVQVDDPDVEVTVRQGGAVVRDRSRKREFVLTAGDGELEVFEKASGMRLTTRKFTLTRGGRETVEVRLEEVRAKKPAVAAGAWSGKQDKARGDADRRAAEWVLSVGGVATIRMEGQDQEIAPGKGLPAGRFQVLVVDLRDNKQVSDAGLAHLQGLANLHSLWLDGTRLSDAGLAHLEGLANLSGLSLTGTPVGDAGLAHVKGLKNLQVLFLPGTRVGDAGLAHLRGLTNLRLLHLEGTLVGDAGVAHLKGLTNLTYLWLKGTRVGDAGLAHLKGLTNLVHLDLRVCERVGDAGLAHLQVLTKLTILDVSGTQVSDAGLAHLQRLTSLRTLVLNAPRVGDAGLAHLKVLPNLEDLRLADTQVSDAGLAQLRGLANLTSLTLNGTRVGDAGLAHLKGLSGLTYLGLNATQVSDAGLAQLKRLTNLRGLSLGWTQVSDAGLPQLKPLARLRVLTLAKASIRGAGLAALAELPALTELRLDYSSFTDADAHGLAELKRLEVLALAHSNVGDDALKHLHGLTKLRELDLTGTRVTAAGLAAARKALPKCRIVGGPAPR